MPSASPRLRSALLLHVITGPMWSGKSRRLIEVVEAQRAAYERVLVVQHAASLTALQVLPTRRSRLATSVHCRAQSQLLESNLTADELRRAVTALTAEVQVGPPSVARCCRLVAPMWWRRRPCRPRKTPWPPRARGRRRLRGASGSCRARARRASRSTVR